MKHVLLTAAAAATIATGATAQEVTLGRFFGACEEAGTDTTTSVAEASSSQSIITCRDPRSWTGSPYNTPADDWGN